MRVHLALIGHKGEPIHAIYSHFAPFRHCDSWLNEHYSGVERFEVDSTGEAARVAAQKTGGAAIGNKQAAKLYGLDILEFPIAQDVENVTRFFVLGHGDGNAASGKKTSLVVSLHNIPGSLFSFLKPFKDTGIDLSRIVSRPVAGHPSDCVFFVDIAGTEKEDAVRKALEAVRQTSIRIKIVGAYPVLPRFDS